MKTDFLNIKNKTFLIFGVRNKKSLAFKTARLLINNGAKVILSVQTEDIKKSIENLFPKIPVHVCNLENEEEIKTLHKILTVKVKLDGILHSVAFANYSKGLIPYHETLKFDFLQAVDISCFSLISIARIFKKNLNKNASVVTISIPSTKMAAENYGYMSSAKAALESTVCNLAKSFSKFSSIRFNTVAAGPLKTSASSSIPGFIDSYLFAEKATLRHSALKTEEVANTALFLLSNSSSGINAQKIVVDAGISVNFFDDDIVKKSI